MASNKMRIRFEGKALECRPNTTVAVALWENGFRHLSHSPKYGRPRGVTCARGHCTACLMRVDSIPNVRVCELDVREGMEIERQDAGAFYAAPMQMTLKAGGSLFPVGFYYKWFTRPASLSRLFLRMIRPLTGVGRVPGAEHAVRALPAADSGPETGNDSTHDLGRFDTIVVGAGPAGLDAATRAEGPVLILDDHTSPGGQRYEALRLLADHPDGVLQRFPTLMSLLEETETLREKVAALDAVTFHDRTRAVAGYSPDGLLLRQEGRLSTVSFGSLVWAAGALDTLGLFPGNDTPGIIGPRALYRLLVRDGMQLQGKQVLVIGGGLDFWLSAALLSTTGASVRLVVTDDGGTSEIPAAVDLKWPLHTGLYLDSVNARSGGRLQASFLSGSADDDTGDSLLNMEADLAVICRRGKPAYDIPFQLGAHLPLQPELGGFTLPITDPSEPGRTHYTLPDGASLEAAGESTGALPGPSVHPAHKGDAR